MPACSLAQASPHVSPIVTEDECSCQCNTEWPTYREDTATCVDTVKGEDTALARNKSHAYYYRMSACRLCDRRIDWKHSFCFSAAFWSTGLPQVRGPNSHEVILSICPSLAGAAWRIICLRIYSLNILLDISPNLTLSFINNANFLYFQRLASHPSLRQWWWPSLPYMCCVYSRNHDKEWMERHKQHNTRLPAAIPVVQRKWENLSSVDG